IASGGAVDEFLTLQEAASYLKVEYKTVYRLVRSGEIPAGKIGGVYRLRKSDIDHFFEKQKETLRKSADTLSEAMVCSFCAKEILSRLGSPGQCRTCGAPLCVSCWDVEGKRFCAPDEKNVLLSKVISSREDAPMSDHTDRNDNTADMDSPHDPPLSRAGKITTEAAKWQEDAFIRRFDMNVRQLDAIQNPITGER